MNENEVEIIKNLKLRDCLKNIEFLPYSDKNRCPNCGNPYRIEAIDIFPIGDRYCIYICHRCKTTWSYCLGKPSTIDNKHYLNLD